MTNRLHEQMTTEFRVEPELASDLETQFTAEFTVVGNAHSVGMIRRPSGSPAPRKRMSSATLFAVIALAITTVGLLYLIQTSEVAGLGYEVSRLERERSEKSLENQQLTYEIARRQSLPAIEEMALNDLEMEPIGDRIYLTVPLPVNDELPVPESADDRGHSLGERIWNRLTGQAAANHPAEGTE